MSFDDQTPPPPTPPSQPYPLNAPSQPPMPPSTPYPYYQPTQQNPSWQPGTVPPPYYPPQFVHIQNQRKGLKTWQIVLISIGGVMVACCLISGIAAALSQSTNTTTTISAANGGTVTTPTATVKTVKKIKPTATPNRPAPTPTPMRPPTATPTALPEWSTVKTFAGSQTGKSPSFNTHKQWRIYWKCTPGSNYFGSYNLIADIYQVQSDGQRTWVDVAVNEICDSSNSSGTSNLYYDPGTYLLDITTEGSYVMEIQEHNS